MAISPCCVRGFEWSGTPEGRVEKIAGLDAYVTGDNSEAAILIVHDLFSWKFTNNRLLADHYAREVGATVYLPDFLAGEEMPIDIMLQDRWNDVDFPAIFARNSVEIREPEVIACAKELRETYKKTAAVGFCWGGSFALRLAGARHQPPLVDCVSMAHPTLITKEDIEGIGVVPVQILAAEVDPTYTDELKVLTFQKLQSVGTPFDYQHFPVVQHGCLTRGDEKKEGERAAMVRGKNAAVAWFTQHLKLT
jgi:dienelactone hydrolase